MTPISAYTKAYALFIFEKNRTNEQFFELLAWSSVGNLNTFNI